MDDPRRSVAAELMLGAVAGTADTVSMGRVSTAINERQWRLIHWQENVAGGGSGSHAVATRKAAGLFGAALGDEQARNVG